MVQDNHLKCEANFFHQWVIFAVTSHIAVTNIFDRHVLDTEAHIVPRKTFTQCFTVHFNRLQLFEDTNLHLIHSDSISATNFVDVLGESNTRVCQVSWWQDAIQSFKQCGSPGIAIFTVRNWHKCYCVRVVATFLNVGADFLNNFLISLPAVGYLLILMIYFAYGFPLSPLRFKLNEGRNGNPLQYSCLENPTGRGAWQATVHGVTKSQT
uniref:Uncharacterized protein n=1 Tax=Muntiacus muntjak TaxID=9888 RepID=A0A5N3UU56_MUNMU|nr:hypothetical protein FD754_023247 [Muntiacus muntjak]